MRVLVAVASVLAVIALAGCGTSGDRSDAETVVGRFYDAVGRHDGEAACAELGGATVRHWRARAASPAAAS